MLGWMRRLFGKGGASHSTVTSLPKGASLTAVLEQKAQIVMEQLNESLKLAHNSTNPDTKVSRLEFAKSKLIELRAIANQHPKMSLTNEGAVLETINRLQEEFAAAGYYGQADISRSAYNPQPMVLNTDPEIVKGWRFSATIQLRTPLRILQMHGVMRDVADGPPERVEMHEGTWTPITKSFGEMGINLPELEIERQCASDIGPVPHDGGRYIGFLKSVRKIVETGESIAIRRANLKSELSKIEWRDFVSRHGGIECVCSRFFPSFLESIPKLTSDSIQSIRTLGLTTPAKLKGEADQELLSIHGIGPAKLKLIRQACEQVDDKDAEWVDLVNR